MAVEPARELTPGIGLTHNGGKIMTSDKHEEVLPLVDQESTKAPTLYSSDREHTVAEEGRECEGSGGDCDGPLSPAKEKKDNGISNLQAMMSIIRASVGIGMLAMPLAYRNAGTFLGLFGTFCIGGIELHCMHLLLNTCRTIRERSGRYRLDFGEVAGAVFEHAGPGVARFSTAAKVVANLFLFSYEIGLTAVYYDFISDNMIQVVGNAGWFPSSQLMKTLILIICLSYVFMMSMRILSYISLVANVCMLIGVAIVGVYCSQDLPDVSEYPAVADISTIPLWFGAAVLAFEGIGIVLPTEEKVRHPEDFGGITGVMNTGMSLAIIVYNYVGYYGYMKFGDDVEASITLNLPLDHWMFILVRLMISLAVLGGYGVQLYVAVQITWSHIEVRLKKKTDFKYLKYIYTASLILFAYIIAMIIPHLDLIISLVGAVSGTTSAIIVPITLDIIMSWTDKDYGRFYWRSIKNVVLLAFGLLGFVAGTGTSLYNVIKSY